MANKELEATTTFNNITYDYFYAQAGEYFKATQDRKAITHEQAISGNKALCLLYLGQTDDWTDVQLHQAVIILELATKREFEVALVNIGKQL